MIPLLITKTLLPLQMEAQSKILEV